MAGAGHPQGLEGWRILVVDDDDDARTYLTAVLEDAGAEVFAVADGEAAVDAARLLRPDLITLDLSMPGKDGGEVLAELRADGEVADIPVCIVTGKPELRRLIYDRPVPPPEGFLTKPVDPQRLVDDLRRILHLARRRRQRQGGEPAAVVH